jgi:hypothetical protein
MSQPVEISDELILDARLTGEVAKRSIADQIEFWAQLGRAIEPLLEGSRVLAIQQAGAAVPLSECLASVDSPEGRRRVAEYGAMGSPRCAPARPLAVRSARSSRPPPLHRST